MATEALQSNLLKATQLTGIEAGFRFRLSLLHNLAIRLLVRSPAFLELALEELCELDDRFD